MATILASVITLFFGIYEYRREHAFRVDILHSQLQLNNYQVASLLSSPPQSPLQGEVISTHLSPEGGAGGGSIGGIRGGLQGAIRVTVIDTLGNVLYDTEEADASRMGNHLQREEIQEALHHGSGYAIKRATSLLSGGERGAGEKYFYSATYFKAPSDFCPPSLAPQSLTPNLRLPKGEGLVLDSIYPLKGGLRGAFIVRSSVPYSAELTASLEHDYTFFYYTAGILALMATALYFRRRYEHSEQEKQRIKRQLTENAAHELKTPAATIEGYLETLVSNPTMPEEKRLDFLERCHVQSRRMSSLLADMSMLSRLDAIQEMGNGRQAGLAQGIVNCQLSNSNCIDAALILRQIEEETASQFRERNIQLQMHVPQTLPMRGDASLIYSLFRNIFSNALAYATDATYFRVEVKAPSNSSFRGEIGFSEFPLKGGSKGAVFTFTDNGPGVPGEHLPHIFERFYRIDKGRSRRLGGTGLGLAIVKNIALQYGGSVTASETPGGGLTIEIELTLSGFASP